MMITKTKEEIKDKIEEIISREENFCWIDYEDNAAAYYDDYARDTLKDFVAWLTK